MLILDRHFILKERLVRTCRLNWYLRGFHKGNINGDEIRVQRNI